MKFKKDEKVTIVHATGKSPARVVDVFPCSGQYRLWVEDSQGYVLFSEGSLIKRDAKDET